MTDDPVPTDDGHWENYQFVSGSRVPGSTSGSAGLDLNYGAVKNLQLTVVLPAEFEHERDTHWMSGEMELAAKYRIITSQPESNAPEVALFPRVFIPTHHADPAHLSLLLPVWIGKDHDSWSWFGGGGYLINPGEGNRNAWLNGVAVTHSAGERTHVGIEIYHQTAATDHDQAFTGINVGVDVRLNQHWTFLGSMGPGVQHAEQQGQYAFYLALKADY